MAAVSAGVNPSHFWALTPYETRLAVEGLNARAAAEYRRSAWLAWHIEAFQRSKRLPPLADVLGRMTGEKPKRMTGPEMLQAVEMLNAALGGKVEVSGDG